MIFTQRDFLLSRAYRKLKVIASSSKSNSSIDCQGNSSVCSCKVEYSAWKHENYDISIHSRTSMSPSAEHACSLKHLGLTIAMTWPCLRESQGQCGKAISLYPSSVLTSWRYWKREQRNVDLFANQFHTSELSLTSRVSSSSLKAFSFELRLDGFRSPREMSYSAWKTTAFSIQSFHNYTSKADSRRASIFTWSNRNLRAAGCEKSRSSISGRNVHFRRQMQVADAVL